MCLAVERKEVMLAHRVERDVADQDHLVVIRGECLDVFSDITMQSREDFSIHAGNAVRRLLKSFSVRILADSDQDLSYSTLDTREIHPFPAFLRYSKIIIVNAHFFYLSLLCVHMSVFHGRHALLLSKSNIKSLRTGKSHLCRDAADLDLLLRRHAASMRICIR